MIPARYRYHMASILQVNGRWRCLIRRKAHRPHCKTFDTRREAEAWGRAVEAAIDGGKASGGAALTLGQVIAEYRRMRTELGRPIDPTTNTHYMLEHLAEDLGAFAVADLTPARLVAWARMRKEQGAGGYTVNMELSCLGTTLRHTASFLGHAFPDVVGAARPLLHYGQLISGGGRRTRRPTDDELTRLLAYLRVRNPVVADAVEVAAITGMRRGEIARIVWADIDPKTKAVLVRQRKHPRRSEAKDEWVPLLGDSWAIVNRQPKEDARIFPVSRETLTDSVTAGTKHLGIPDLHLHDLRREATSRLREMGFDADARKAVTGHRSDEIHSRYVSVSLESLHEQYAAARGTQPRPPRPRKARARQP